MVLWWEVLKYSRPANTADLGTEEKAAVFGGIGSHI